MSRFDCVLYGSPLTEALPSALQELGKSRAFLMVSSSLQMNTSVISDAIASLGDNFAGAYAGMPAHSPRKAVVDCIQQFRASNADCLVTVGGGSLTDAAKAVRIACAAELAADPHEFDKIRDGREHHHITLAVGYIAVPTTLSAGEFTNISGVTNEATEQKELLVHPACAPDLVIFDSAITMHTPEWLFLSTGMRSIDHCVEALCALPAGAPGAAPGQSWRANPYGDGLGVAGLQLLIPGLRKCKADPGDLSARLQCQIGSYFAIRSISQNGGGCSHAIGHILGGTFDVPHGYTSCVMLPATCEWNIGVNAQRQARVAAAFGRPNAEAGAGQAIREFVAELELPTTLSDVGVTRGDFELAAKNTMHDRGIRNNPRLVRSREDILEILELAAGDTSGTSRQSGPLAVFSFRSPAISGTAQSGRRAAHIMVIPPEDRPYPVVLNAPGFQATVGNFGISEVITWGGITAISAPFGWFVGKPVRGPSMAAATFLGCLGGFMLAFQSSNGKLMGLTRNGR